MSSKRLRMTQAQYQELIDSRDWCARMGMTGLREFYDEHLAMHAFRRSLPLGAREYQQQEQEDEARRSR